MRHQPDAILGLLKQAYRKQEGDNSSKHAFGGIVSQGCPYFLSASEKKQKRIMRYSASEEYKDR